MFRTVDEKRRFQRVWRARRRAEFFADKECVSCGSVTDLELDHVDPSQKVSHKIWSWSVTRRQAELAKCQVLCCSCHKKKTAADRTVTDHGTAAVYKSGCRCDTCRQYERDRKREWRAHVAQPAEAPDSRPG